MENKEVTSNEKKEIIKKSNIVQHSSDKNLTRKHADMQSSAPKNQLRRTVDIQSSIKNHAKKPVDKQIVDTKNATRKHTDKQTVDIKNVTRKHTDLQTVDIKNATRRHTDKQTVDIKNATRKHTDLQTVDTKNATKKHVNIRNSMEKEDKNADNIEKKEKTTKLVKNNNIKKISTLNNNSDLNDENNETRITPIQLTVKKNNVTDIKDIQKAALENEKRKKRQERIENAKNRIEQLKTTKAKIYISIISIILVFLIFVSLTIINDIQVDEGKHYTKKEVKNLVIKNIFDYNSVYLYLKYRYSDREPIPFVEYIDVYWIDKNTVKLKVYDKNIIGCTNYMNEYVYFDKDGYVVETSVKREKEIPFITGINFEELTLNRKIKVKDEEIFDVILTTTQQIAKYELEIDEIKFDKSFNLTLISDNITVLLGKQEAYDEQLAKLKSMLDEAKKEKLSGVLHMEKYKEGQDRIIFDKNH